MNQVMGAVGLTNLPIMTSLASRGFGQLVQEEL